VEIWLKQNIHLQNNTHLFPHTKLLKWFSKEARPLPWREHYDPYQVAISEYMLQQTQIITALPYFDRWVNRWENWTALANASEEDVLAMWSGLGYYSRAKRLRLLAQTVANTYGGVLPNDKEELLKLPGIGDYTASAISAIAFNQASFPIDGNVRRVLSRFFANKEKSPSKEQDAFLNTQMIPVFNKTKKCRELAQALMELGALICSPKTNCQLCPLKSDCLAYQNDSVEQYPLKKKKSKTENIFIHYCWVHDNEGNYLLKQRPNKGRFSNFFEPPAIESSEESEAFKKLSELLNQKNLIRQKAFISHFTKYKAKWTPYKHKVHKNFKLKNYQWVHASQFENLNFVPKMIEQFNKSHDLQEC